MKLTAETTVFNEDAVQSKFSELVVDADGIRTEVSKKVGNDEVISRINQSAESVSIEADKIEFVTPTSDGTGIKVHTPKSSANYTNINADGVQIYKSNVKVADFGTNVVLGKDAEQHVEMDTDSFEFHDGSNGVFFGIDGSSTSTGSSVKMYTYPLDYPHMSASIARGSEIAIGNDYTNNVSRISIRSGGRSAITGNSATASISLQPCYYLSEDYTWEGDYLTLYPSELVYRDSYTNQVYFRITGDKITAPARTLKKLWTGTYYMTAAHTATLSEPISDQLHGIVLAWSAYTNGAAQDYGWHYQFIPKNYGGDGQGVSLLFAASKFSHVGTKYVYVNNNSIVGHADNSATGTANGITYNNGYWVLRTVFGV